MVDAQVTCPHCASWNPNFGRMEEIIAFVCLHCGAGVEVESPRFGQESWPSPGNGHPAFLHPGLPVRTPCNDCGDVHIAAQDVYPCFL